MTIYISPSVNGIIKDSFDTNIELSGWFLAEKINDGDLRIGNTSLALGQEMNVSPLQIPIPEDYKKLVQEAPDQWEVLSGHLHARRYGDNIEVYDPYWTITVNECDDLPGTIVEREFFVSRKIEKGRLGGDSAGLEALVDFGRMVSVPLDKALFVHPRYGTEGKVMRREDVQITGYEFDVREQFNVRRLDIKVLG